MYVHKLNEFEVNFGLYTSLGTTNDFDGNSSIN